MTPPRHPASSSSGGLLLPEGARLLHIGPPKTGTTALQAAARAARKRLRSHGVIYPGSLRHHRHEIFALMGHAEPRLRRTDGLAVAAGKTRHQLEKVPPIKLWRALMAELDAAPAMRAFISNEGAAACTLEQAKRFVAELGADRIQVVITLRPRAAILASLWNQRLKAGQSESFETWLRRLYGLAEPPMTPITARYIDHGGLVETWVEAAGPDHVTVIVLDPANRQQLPGAFEQMLGLPAGLLADVQLDGKQSNRSMSAVEAELIRSVNERVFTKSTSWPAFQHVISRGAVQRIQSFRKPAAAEPRLQLPAWAAERAVADAHRDVERIAASGARVIGDLELLTVSPTASADSGSAVDVVPLDLAVEAVVGSYRGAARLESATRKAAGVSAPAATDLTSRALIRLLVRRLLGRLRRLAGRGN